MLKDPPTRAPVPMAHVHPQKVYLQIARQLHPCSLLEVIPISHVTTQCNVLHPFHVKRWQSSPTADRITLSCERRAPAPPPKARSGRSMARKRMHRGHRMMMLWRETLHHATANHPAVPDQCGDHTVDAAKGLYGHTCAKSCGPRGSPQAKKAKAEGEAEILKQVIADLRPQNQQLQQQLAQLTQQVAFLTQQLVTASPTIGVAQPNEPKTQQGHEADMEDLATYLQYPRFGPKNGVGRILD
eukprot:3770784-Amphidinium_carterae.2